MYTADTIIDISLSGTDARVIISSVEDLKGCGAGEILEGVLRFDRMVRITNESNHFINSKSVDNFF